MENVNVNTPTSKKSVSASSMADSLRKFILPLVLLLILLLQGVIVYYILNPYGIYQQLQSVQTINKVSKATQVPPNEFPQVGVIGDGKNLAKADDIRKGNAIDAQIYKDAKDGDYVLGYSSKLVIYRPSDDHVVYDGQTPQAQLASSQKQLVDQVIAKAKSAKAIPETYNSTPQVSVVQDPDQLKKTNEFYADAQKNDVVAIFSNPDLIMIYRPSADAVVKTGSFKLQ